MLRRTDMGTKAAGDKALSASEALGEIRVENARRFNTFAMVPDCRLGGREAAYIRRVYASTTADALRLYHLELLKRSAALLDFIDENVGPTVDYPLRIRGDNQMSVNMLSVKVNELRAAVGLLLDL